jgi:hypothetical protein
MIPLVFCTLLDLSGKMNVGNMFDVQKGADYDPVNDDLSTRSEGHVLKIGVIFELVLKPVLLVKFRSRVIVIVDPAVAVAVGVAKEQLEMLQVVEFCENIAIATIQMSVGPHDNTKELKELADGEVHMNLTEPLVCKRQYSRSNSVDKVCGIREVPPGTYPSSLKRFTTDLLVEHQNFVVGRIRSSTCLRNIRDVVWCVVSL